METHELDPEKRRRLALGLDPQAPLISAEHEELARALMDPRPDASIGSYDPFGNSVGTFGAAVPSPTPQSSDHWRYRMLYPSGAPFLPLDQLPEGDGPKFVSPTEGLWGAGYKWVRDGGKLHAAGMQTLINNPLLSFTWQPTYSRWTDRGGVSKGVADFARERGIQISNQIWPSPPGSYGPEHAYLLDDDLAKARAKANNKNGRFAENTIAQSLRDQGYRVVEQQRLPGRTPDVVAYGPAEGVIGGVEKRFESKVGRVTLDSDIRRQLDHDVDTLGKNEQLRQSGEASRRTGRLLRGFGRVAVPVGLTMDAYELSQAHAADGNRIGENTRRAASGIAGGALGGWGGAALGAAFGAPFGLPGWIIGPLVGGFAGSMGGSSLARSIHDQLRRSGPAPTTSQFYGAP